MDYRISKPGIAIALFLLCTLISISGQEFKMKFGDIERENLAMQAFENDTSVSAMVIGDFGDIRFIYAQDRGFKTVYTRHTRIKIFNKKGYGQADQMLQLYNSGNLKDNMGRLRAATYNLEGNKIVTSKMSKKAVFREDINDYWESVKFTLPDIKEGCIIEFEYTINSDRLFNLPVWYFQRTIPVQWSELNVDVPEYFVYKQLATGYDPIQINTQRQGSGSITISSKSRSSAYTGQQTSFQNDNIKYTTNIYRMATMNVPPFIEEPYLTTKDNYILKVKFELEREQWPGRATVLHTESWESIIKKLLDDSRFGGQLELGLFLNKRAGEINDSGIGQLDKIVAAHEYIKGHMKWNGYNDKYSENLRTAFNDQSGSSADINLMLVLMLRKLDLKAYPVVLSTRNHGMINKFFPLISTFNYVVAAVSYEDQILLLDATDPNCVVNLLPERCLNGEGLIVDKNIGNFININPTKSSDYKSVVSLALSSDGDLTGTMVDTNIDYAAFNTRDEIDDEDSQEDYIESIEESLPGLEVVSYEVENLDDLYKPVIEKYEINISGYSEVAGDMIYLNPLFFERMDSNPFRVEDRKYPIDFGNTFHEVMNLELKIPEGYVVEELPQNLSLKLGDDRIVYNYKISEADGIISFVNEMHINDFLFVYNDYADLKEVFNKIVDKNSEMIVIKKSESSPE